MKYDNMKCDKVCNREVLNWQVGDGNKIYQETSNFCLLAVNFLTWILQWLIWSFKTHIPLNLMLKLVFKIQFTTR